MWLIDENLNVRLYQVLSELGIIAHSVSYAGLKGLKNGELLAAAQRMAYSTILTRDNLYAQDSGFLGGSYPEIGIVVIEVRVPQDTFLDWFRKEFVTNQIQPIPGKVIFWP